MLWLYGFLVSGLFLLFAPWTPVWVQAVHAMVPTSLERWMLGGWLRGVISGLGAIDLIVALQVGSELWSGRGAGPEPPVGGGPV